MPVTHTLNLVEFQQKIIFDPPPSLNSDYQTLLQDVPPLGHDPGEGMKNLFNMFYIFHLLEDALSLVEKYLKLAL